MPDPGHIELERTVDSIVVGARHRDPGDVEDLKRSLDQVGLLQPITISPDGVLLCGRRRLEAVRQLQWRTVRVWVRSGISDALSSVLALNHENALHKPLTMVEAAPLYREYRRILSEDAARRQRATWFGAVPDLAPDEGEDGAGKLPVPSRTGRAREQAAIMVTGGADSHTRLDRVGELQDLAADPDQPQAVRGVAAEALAAIHNGAPVIPNYRRVADVRRAAATSTDDELDAMAKEALARVNQPRTRKPSSSTSRSTPRTHWSVRSFVLTWADMDGWWSRFDPVEVGRSLKDGDWSMFERVLRETNAFAEKARRARAEATEPVTV